MTTPRQPVTRQVRTYDLPLGPGRMTLRMARVEAGHDEPATLVLSCGFGGSDGTEFRRPPWETLPLRVPAEIIPELIEALQQLQEEIEP